jgi:hypothetical protein
MSARYADGAGYLAMYPDLRRWINTCVCCQFSGYKPEMPPNDDPLFKGQNLRRYFSPLEVDAEGLCAQCSAASSR